MAFNTPEYWTFFAVVLLVSGCLRPLVRFRIVFLSIASFYFYYANNGYLTLLIVFGTLFDYFAALRISSSESRLIRKRWLTASITSNLLILSIFKYAHLLLTTAAHGLNLLGVRVQEPTFTLLLPVGISFYTFEAISYVVDVYRGNFQPRTSWREFNYFIVFFPKLTAGPIIRPHHFFKTISEKNALTEGVFESYLQMIFLGLVQKVVLADTMAPIADAAYAIHGATDSFATLVGVYAFSLQIYFDFVGYSNIAIGSAGLLGVDLPDNFRRPYIASSLSNFWKRWHLSLSTWLRDYLYIPLGGGRGTLLKVCRNLMITMTLGGLWHGASWNFAIWGGLNGAILCLERVFRLEDKVDSWLDRNGNGFRLIWSMLTFTLFSLLWIPFRARTFTEFLDVVTRLTAFSMPAVVTLQQIAVCGLAFVTILVCLCDERLAIQDWASRVHPLIKAPVFAAMALAAFSFSSQGTQPFIYFRF